MAEELPCFALGLVEERKQPCGFLHTPELEGPSRCFGFVQTYDSKPKRRLFELLKGQGMQMNQQVMFFSDGGSDIREVRQYLNPEAEHYLDWFHLTMQITVLRQYAKGLDTTPERRDEGLKVLEGVKHYQWQWQCGPRARQARRAARPSGPGGHCRRERPEAQKSAGRVRHVHRGQSAAHFELR
jgi:hypothetical protein